MTHLLKGTAEFEQYRNDMFWHCCIMDNSEHNFEFFHCKWTGYDDDYWWTNAADKNKIVEVTGDKGTKKAFVLDYNTLEVKEYGLELPDDDYEKINQDGQIFTCCTLRQVAKHTIGLDHRVPYKRHGKRFYRPYRNYFNGKNQHCEKMLEFGYMEKDADEKQPTYRFTRSGLDWLGDQLDMKIYNEEE